MRRESLNPEQNRRETAETLDTAEKEKISERLELFFQKFSAKHRKPERTALREIEEKNWIQEVRQLDENDPGYVNGLVLDYDNEENNPKNTYRETGKHTGAIRWGDYAVEGSETYITLRPGTRLVRWGDENGTFLAQPDTSYEKLELPVVQEKQSRNLYEVCKPFPAEKSLVEKQPWNKEQSGGSPAIQYKVPVSIKQLVEKNYLRRVENEGNVKAKNK